jgi:hypothetical protein
MGTTPRALLLTLSLLAPSLSAAREPKPRPLIKIKGAVVVEGRAHKPRAFIVLRRSTVGWETESQGADLLARVRDDAERLPAETVEP